MRDRSGLVLLILIILLIYILAQNGLLGGLLSGGGIVIGSPIAPIPTIPPLFYATTAPSGGVLPPAYAPTAYGAPTYSGPVVVPTAGSVPAGGVSQNGQCIVPNGWVAYTVQPGDTLAVIAQNYNLTADQLASANCLQNPDLIYEGEIIAVPGR